MIGLIGAMSVEIEALEGRLEEREETRIGMHRFVSGRLFGHEAVLAVCGPGKVNAALCAQAMILRFQPEWVLNLGVAGSGESGVGIGDMVIADAAVQHDMDTSPLGDPPGYVSMVGLTKFPCDADLAARLLRAAGKVEGMRVHRGIVATGDQFIHSAEQRTRIHDLFRAKAVEMEGAAVAHACLMNGTPCAILRSISDNADGGSDMDYPAFVTLAAAHSQRVVGSLLTEEAAQ